MRPDHVGENMWLGNLGIKFAFAGRDVYIDESERAELPFPLVIGDEIFISARLYKIIGRRLSLEAGWIHYEVARMS